MIPPFLERSHFIFILLWQRNLDFAHLSRVEHLDVLDSFDGPVFLDRVTSRVKTLIVLELSMLKAGEGQRPVVAGEVLSPR